MPSIHSIRAWSHVVLLSADHELQTGDQPFSRGFLRELWPSRMSTNELKKNPLEKTFQNRNPVLFMLLTVTLVGRRKAKFSPVNRQSLVVTLLAPQTSRQSLATHGYEST